MADDKPKTPPEEPILDDQGYPRRCRGLEPLGAILPDAIESMTQPKRIPNDPKHEFMFEVCRGQSRSRQKRLIMLARHPDVAVIEDADAEILISALGLKEA